MLIPNKFKMINKKIKSRNIIYLLVQLWHKIHRKRKIKFIYIAGVIVASTFSEVVSLSLIIPFLGILTKPEYLTNHKIFSFLPIDLGSINPFLILSIITAFVILFSFAAGFFRIYTLWQIKKLGAELGSDFSVDVYRRLLYKPYSYYLKIDSSNLIATLTADINDLINMVITPLLNLIASSIVAISLITTLLVINGSLSIITFSIIFSIYFISLKLSDRTLQKLGLKKTLLRSALIKNIQEGFGSIREIKLENNQEFHSKIYKSFDKPLRITQTNIAILSILPKSFVDPAGISIIALLGLFLNLKGGFSNSLPLLGALALGAQKLIPHSQIIYKSWASLKGTKAILIKVIKLLENKIPKENLIGKIKPYTFKKNIRFNNISFNYDQKTGPVLKDINLLLNKGERIGIIGKTGSGKSTLLDLVMGLIRPSNGEILIDSQNLYDPLKPKLLTSWRLSISHVPQNIFLTNATITENIAFGIPKNEINFERVKQVAKQACISKFIEESKDGYSSMTGERGIRLSGGQRQRIGIARALYKRAEILVFDEATSALDNETEELIINSLANLGKEITILFISHRYSTLRNCDRIIKLHKGKIVSEGSFEEMS